MTAPGMAAPSGDTFALWTTVELPAGDALFRKGDPGDAFYTVVEGEIDIFTEDGVRLERLVAGDHFGELALLAGGFRHATASCVTAVRLRRLDRATFLANIGRDGPLTDMTIQMLGARMTRTSAYLDYVTAWARLVTDGQYEVARTSILADAAARADGNIGSFIRSFVEMVDAIQDRERDLKRRLQDLQIEFDRASHAREVTQITTSDFFQSLQGNAERIRARMRGQDDSAGGRSDAAGD